MRGGSGAGAASGELDEFRLVRPLGSGGMGEVYLGHDTVLDRAVAIKLIGARSPDAASRERFLIEARAIARLSHPNVVAIYRAGTTGDGRPFLVQELIRGKSLDRVPRPVPWRQVCELAIGVARGLEAAHRRGILHRDVKPANVMLDEHGTARLLDFGVAKLTGAGEVPDDEAGAGEATAEAVKATADPDATRDPDRAVADTREETPAALARDAVAALGRLPATPEAARAEHRASPVTGAGLGPTAPGTVLGTPRYTAPEIWRGEPASVASDLYSLGVMLYELLAGVAPYPQTEAAELHAAVTAGGARPVAELAPAAHPALAGAVMRCLALDPRARPGSAAAIAHELEAAIAGAPAVPEGNPYRGLRAFDAAHRGLFFGRGADVDAILDRLRTEPLLAVVGDSGIGKSSVCHAGVVPAVLAGGLADRRSWRAVSMVPGRAPWAALCDALGAGADDVDALVRALVPAAGAGVLLVIDQLEELVTLSAPAEAARVAEALAAIAGGSVPGVRALLAVRGDFLTRVAALPELGAPMARGLHLLRALSAADLREAVVGPARATGVRFETDAMVEALVDAAAGNPGALPLLQFTLAELWQARDVARGVITAGALERLGGVGGALAGHADRVLLSLGAGARGAARRILLRLVTPAGTRAVRDRAELAGEREALERLVRGRLVVARDTAAGTPSYELAHEALIRSWGTLRDWLDEEAGQLAARHRVGAGAAEWQRLGRRPDLLWTRRQLDEVRALGGLTADERAFVEASRRRVHRQRLVRGVAIAAVPAIVLAVLGVWLVNVRARDQAFAAFVDAAAPHQARAAQLAAESLAARGDAFRRFDADDERAEARWADARRLSEEAHREYGAAAAQLEAAFQLDGSAARARIAAVLWAALELAEAEHDDGRVGTLLRRLASYDPERAARWHQPGRIVLALDRPGRIAVHAFRCYKQGPDCVPGGGGPTIAGGFDAQPRLVREGARLDAELPPGSYIAVIAAPDGHVVRAPFVISRSERIEQAIRVPPLAKAPPGFVHVPAGDFLYGSGHVEEVRKNLEAQPLHRVHGGAFWISRTEVTFAQWLAYLRALPPGERAPHLPAGEGVTFEEQPDGRFVLTLEPMVGQRHRAAEGEPIVYPGRKVRREVRWEKLPAVGVSYADAVAYAAWLDRTGRVRGARVCTAHEWEHAARGADGRSYPHGNALDPSHASIDMTHGRVPGAYGPEEVGSFPVSDSPYGIADLAGNVWEPTTSRGGKPSNKGGSFFQTAFAATSENMGNPGDPNLGKVKNGLRICADAARAR